MTSSIGLWTRHGATAVLDRRGEAVFDVPGEVDPLRLLELLDEGVDDRPARGLGVERGEIGLRQELAHGLGGAPGVDEVVDQQIALAVAAHALEDLDVALHLRRAPGGAAVVARDADRVDEADIELPRHQRRGHQAAARDGDDALPRAELVQLRGKEPGVAVQLHPGNDDLVLVGHARHTRFYRFACPRKAQPVNRASIMAVAAYSAIPSTASTSRPANTIGTWNAACASSISLPMPLFAPTVSETTAPTKASVIATLSEPKK